MCLNVNDLHPRHVKKIHPPISVQIPKALAFVGVNEFARNAKQIGIAAFRFVGFVPCFPLALECCKALADGARA